MLRALHFEGDGQADLKVHGGPDRAVCVYSHDHYPFWEKWAGEKLELGAFSENLTIDGISETAISIGDTFSCGEVLVQVSQPRLPCSKLASKRGRTDLPEAIRATLFTGFYLRVLREGVVRVGDPFKPVSTHAAGVTVALSLVSMPLAILIGLTVALVRTSGSSALGPSSSSGGSWTRRAGR